MSVNINQISNMAAMFFLILALMISFLFATTVVYSDRPAAGFRPTMIRTEKAINFTRAAQRSHERMSMLATRLDAAASGRMSTQAPLQVDGVGYEYNMELSIGTPPQKLLATADTGSNLTWIKCGACTNCTPEGGPSYNPGMSTSFSMLPCSDRLCRAICASTTCGFGGAECEYFYGYGLEPDPHVYTRGFLGNETFTLGDDPVLGGGEAVPGVGFGCTTVSEGIYIYGASSGIVGLGRGPLSLVSQLNVGAFSYCLSGGGSMTSPLLFGSLAALTGAGVQSTPLLATGTYYSVSLERILVGEVTTVGPGMSGYGVVLDSGTTFTYLVEPFYMLAKAAVLNQTTLPWVGDRYGFEACFQASVGGVWDVFPAMVLHFDGADMALPTSSCFGQVDDDGVMCWMVQRSPSLSIIGNVMQRDYHIRYDLDEGTVSFQPARCDNL